MLKGQAKTDYMRGYMRRRRSNKKGLTKDSGSNKLDTAAQTRALSGYKQPTRW